jgi:hypothetical protein
VRGGRGSADAIIGGVNEAEFFERFDAYLAESKEARLLTDELLERNREAFERNAEAFERNAEAFERNMQALDRHQESHEDLRTFIRDITNRNEKVWRGVMNRLDDMGDEIRAQTAAILNVLDRLEGTT